MKPGLEYLDSAKRIKAISLPGLGSTLADGLSGRAALARSIAARCGGQTAEDLMEESVIARMRQAGGPDPG